MITQTGAPPPDTPPPPPPPAPPMGPGRYIRLRREAAGLDIDAVAKMVGHLYDNVAGTISETAKARNLLIMLEEGQPEAHTGDWLELVDALSLVFRFEPFVYHALVGLAADPESELPCPQICRGCGCTWNDPCLDGLLGCAWSDADPNLCTVCECEAHHEA